MRALNVNRLKKKADPRHPGVDRPTNWSASLPDQPARSCEQQAFMHLHAAATKAGPREPSLLPEACSMPVVNDIPSSIVLIDFRSPLPGADGISFSDQQWRCHTNRPARTLSDNGLSIFVACFSLGGRLRVKRLQRSIPRGSPCARRRRLDKRPCGVSARCHDEFAT